MRARGLQLWWRIVRGETELGLVLGEFRVKLFRSVVIAALGCYCDFRPQFGNAAFEDDFRCVRQDLGGGAAVEGTFDRPVSEEVAGTFPLIFILFLLFSLGELGITRGVICGSPGLVNSCSPGVVICASLGAVNEGSDSAVGNGSCSSRTAMQKSPSSAVCIHGCQRNR